MAYLTYSDVILHLKDYLGGNASTEADREIRRAIRSAARELAAEHPWRCLHRVHHIVLQPQYSTGTVTYVNSTRTWTLSGGTFPTNAGECWIRVTTADGDTDDYLMHQRTGGTTCIGDSVLNPGSDISSAATYILYQNEYPLPEDFLQGGEILPRNSFASQEDSSDSFLRHRLAGAAGQVFSFNIVADRRRPGRMAIRFESWPSEADTVQFWYRREAREPKYNGFAARDKSGTITVSTTAVTGDGTAFEAGHVGCILRASANATAEPTDQDGDNPFLFEDVILARDSATSVTLYENSVTQSTAVKYTISDPIDFSRNLWNVFLRCCEKQSEIIRQREGSGKNDAVGLYQEALAKAKVSDRRNWEERSMLDGFTGRYSRASLEREQVLGTDVTGP